MPAESPTSIDKLPVQFTLRTLLLVVSASAAALGAVRWLGVEVLPFLLVAVGIWVTARSNARHLLVWLIPSLWSLSAFGSWHHPGDEYGMFCVSILVSLWLVLLLNSVVVQDLRKGHGPTAQPLVVRSKFGIRCPLPPPRC